MRNVLFLHEFAHRSVLVQCIHWRDCKCQDSQFVCSAKTAHTFSVSVSQALMDNHPCACTDSLVAMTGDMSVNVNAASVILSEVLASSKQIVGAKSKQAFWYLPRCRTKCSWKINPQKFWNLEVTDKKTAVYMLPITDFLTSCLAGHGEHQAIYKLLPKWWRRMPKHEGCWCLF